jgi:hypothetical protein
MKIKILITTALMGCAIAALAFAADLTGTWTGTLTAPQGELFPVHYTFKLDGDKLTGTGTSPDGDIPISDGTINGSDFAFTVTFNGQMIKNTGKYYAAADSVGLNVELNGMVMHTTLKRAQP